MERDIKSNDVKLEFFYKPDLKVEYKTGIKFGKEKNSSIYNNINLYYISFVPSFRYSFTQKGRMNGEFEWFKVKTNPKVNTIFLRNG